MVKKIIYIAVLLLMLFGLCACGISLPFLIDLEYEELPYDLSDVTLNFSYGLKKPMIKDGLKDESAYVYGDAHLFFTNVDISGREMDYSSSDIFLIKTIAREEFFSEEYLCSENSGEPINFNHSEMITVPQELFEEESGTIFFYLRIDRSHQGSEFDVINYIFFYYELEDDKVTITNVNLNR